MSAPGKELYYRGTLAVSLSIIAGSPPTVYGVYNDGMWWQTTVCQISGQEDLMLKSQDWVY